MATTTRWWTAADLEELPNDGCRYEVLEGELFVTPAPAFGHNLVASRLARLLGDYCEAHGIGAALGPGAVRWKQNELQPDVFVSRVASTVATWSDVGLPLLVIEVHSPITHLRDRGVKRATYMGLGIPEYWQVNLEEKTVLVTQQERGDVLAASVLEWRPYPDIPALLIDLATLFR
jgi:Uma2 family endonuclease